MERRPDPIRRLELSPTDKLLERACLGFLITTFAIALVAYFFLPPELEIHYRGNRPDAHGSRMYIFLPILLGAFCYVLLTALSRYAYLWRSTKPRTAEENLARYRRSIRTMRIIKLILILSFSIGLFATIRLYVRPSEGISWALYTVEGIFIGIPALYILFNLLKGVR
jgi:uncharacterized membrane protein